MDSCWWLSLLVFLVLNYGMTMTMGSDLGMRDYGMDGFCLWHAEHYDLAALQRWKKNCFVPSRPLLGDGKWWKNCVLIHFLGSNGKQKHVFDVFCFQGSKHLEMIPFCWFFAGASERGKTNMCSMRYSFKGSTTWWSPFFRKMAVGKRCLLDSDDETNVQNKVG